MIFQCSSIVNNSGLILDSSLLSLHSLTQWGGRTERTKWKNSWVEFNMWRKDKEKSKGNPRPANSNNPHTPKKVHFSAFIPDIICHGISLLASLCQVCRLCSFQACCPLREGRAGERRPWHCPFTAQQSPELLCYQHFQSHPKPGMLWRKLPPSQPDSVRCQMYMKAQRPTFMS